MKEIRSHSFHTVWGNSVFSPIFKFSSSASATFSECSSFPGSPLLESQLNKRLKCNVSRLKTKSSICYNRCFGFVPGLLGLVSPVLLLVLRLNFEVIDDTNRPTERVFLRTVTAASATSKTRIKKNEGGIPSMGCREKIWFFDPPKRVLVI